MSMEVLPVPWSKFSSLLFRWIRVFMWVYNSRNSPFTMDQIFVTPSPSSKFICWNLMPHVMALGSEALQKCLGHENEARINGISALMKAIPQSFLIPFHQLRTHSTFCEPESRSLLDTKSVLHLELSNIQKHKPCISRVYKTLGLWYFVTAPQRDYSTGRPSDLVRKGSLWSQQLFYYGENSKLLNQLSTKQPKGRKTNL